MHECHLYPDISYMHTVSGEMKGHVSIVFTFYSLNFLIFLLLYFILTIRTTNSNISGKLYSIVHIDIFYQIGKFNLKNIYIFA